MLINHLPDEHGESQWGNSDHYEFSRGRDRFDKVRKSGLSQFKNPYGNDPVAALLVEGESYTSMMMIPIRTKMGKMPSVIYTEALIVHGKILAEVRADMD